MAKVKIEKWLTHDSLLLLEAWARDGLSDVQIARNIGIGKITLSDWKLKYPIISQALKSGREIADIKVENALFKRALGFDYDEVKEEYKDGVLLKTTVTKKHAAPDISAQRYWLRNRKPLVWCDKPDVPDSDNGESGGGLTDLSELLENPAEIRRISDYE